MVTKDVLEVGVSFVCCLMMVELQDVLFSGNVLVGALDHKQRS